MLQSRVSPFPFQMGTMWPIFQSVGMTPVLHTEHMRLCNHSEGDKGGSEFSNLKHFFNIFSNLKQILSYFSISNTFFDEFSISKLFFAFFSKICFFFIISLMALCNYIASFSKLGMKRAGFHVSCRSSVTNNPSQQNAMPSQGIACSIIHALEEGGEGVMLNSQLAIYNFVSLLNYKFF